MKKILFVICLGMLSGCIKDDEVITDKEQLEIDLAIIDTYLAENQINAVPDPSGLRYVIHEAGTGISPLVTDVVNVDYIGKFLTDGTIFDQNEDIEFRLSSLIEGWQIGFPLLKEGGVATLYLPSVLAYGKNPPPGIPANANLIFDVVLNRVVK